MFPTVLLLALLSVDSPPAPSVKAPSPGPATPAMAFGPEWDSILGDWTGEGTGSPGTGGGIASFRPDLDRRVLIRRNVSDYPASEGRAAVHHEDLMVIYPGTSSGETSAIYFDNEGHVIPYAARWSPDGKTLTFTSLPAGGPRFRLVYRIGSPGSMSVEFEIAPPGSAEFKRYVGGVMKRTSTR